MSLSPERVQVASPRRDREAERQWHSFTLSTRDNSDSRLTMLSDSTMSPGPDLSPGP